MVDSTENQIGSTSGQKLVERNLNTIDRRATTRPHLDIPHVVSAFQAQRLSGREGTGEARPGAFGCHNKHLAPVFKETDKRLDSIGMIAIIIRNEH